ncbi:MAG: hypothetical protein V4481_02475 [Patescibacteria group bacterium]
MKHAQPGAVIGLDGVEMLSLPQKPSWSPRQMNFKKFIWSKFQADPKVSVVYDHFRWVALGIVFVGVVWIPLMEWAWNLFQALTK